jgi:hypothetical protein
VLWEHKIRDSCLPGKKVNFISKITGGKWARGMTDGRVLKPEVQTLDLQIKKVASRTF